MPDYVPISKETHKDQRWTPSGNFLFAAKDSLCPLVMQELPAAHLHLPIAFSKVEDHFGLFAVQALESECNYLVDAEGQWLADYVPAAYRGYPFALIGVDDDRHALCIDADSGLIGATGDNAFFDEIGNSTELINKTLNFLSSTIASQKSTNALCLLLEELDLLEAWPISIKTGDSEVPLQGLYRVNEVEFNKLENEKLIRLHEQRALPLIFCQLLSMQNMSLLAKLSASRHTVADLGPELTFGIPSDDGNISFEGL